MSETETQPSTPASGNGETGRATRPKPARVLPTDRIRFDKQLDILRAFVAASGHERKPVTNKDVGGVVSMADSTIAQITPFFVDVGLVVREKRDKKVGSSTESAYIPSAEASAYQKAYEWDKLNAAKKLAPVIYGTWFVETLLPKLKFRPVNEKEAINDLGEVASVGPDKEQSLRNLIEYLMAAGIAERDALGMLRASNALASLAEPAMAPPAVTAPPPAAATVLAEPSGVKQHQLWLLEILNAYPDLSDDDQDAILKLIKTIKAGGKGNASPAANE